MTVYASFDVSDKVCAVHVVEPDGREVWRGVCATDPQEMAQALRRHAPGLVRVVMETGPLAVYLEFWGHCVIALVILLFWSATPATPC